MDIKEFEDKMEKFFSKARKVKDGREYLDSCGRECHSDNVFVMPVSLKDEFLDFVGELARTSVVGARLEDGESRPKCHVIIGYTPGSYSHPGVYRDYDGIQECDMAPVEPSGKGWMIVNFRIFTKKGYEVEERPYEGFV